MKTSLAAINAALDALGALLDGGYLRLYTGPQPDAPEDAATGTLLAELRFGDPAFAAAVNGGIEANSVTPDLSAAENGTAGWCRCLRSDGTTAVLDGDVATSGAFCNLTSTNIVAGAKVELISLTITQPQA